MAKEEHAEPADELADAEAKAAEARARATAARARADQARKRAQGDSDPAPAVDAPAPAPKVKRIRKPRRNRRVPALVTATLGVLVVFALLGGAGYIIAKDRSSARDRDAAAEFTAAARQGVVNLMAINYNTAQVDVQRVLNSATGTFKEDFGATSKDLVKALQDAKVLTEVNVKHAAVESMTGDSAVVLVSAVTQRGDAEAKDRDPRTWRAVVTVKREQGQIKVSQLDFV